MKTLSRILAVNCSLFVVGTLASGGDRAEAKDNKANFQEALEQCVDKKAGELSVWDRITAPTYNNTDWLRRCQAEVSNALNLQLDNNYSGNSTADLEFREQLRELDKLMTPTMSQELAKQLELGSTVIKAKSDTSGRSIGVSEAPIINTVNGYSTRRGGEN